MPSSTARVDSRGIKERCTFVCDCDKTPARDRQLTMRASLGSGRAPVAMTSICAVLFRNSQCYSKTSKRGIEIQTVIIEEERRVS